MSASVRMQNLNKIANCNGDRYRVTFVPASSIKPSPENETIYGPIDTGSVEFAALVDSIRTRDLSDPLSVTADFVVKSGHRRLAACDKLGYAAIPCHVDTKRRNEYTDEEWLAELAAYNPQRAKSVGAMFREAILRDSKTLEDTTAAVRRVGATHFPSFEPEYAEIDGSKQIDKISANRKEFLNAAIKVISELEDFWPLSVRQIHYRLLNNPPLKSTPERSKFDIEHYRYRNDKASYRALVDLLTIARYRGHIPFHVIDDSTRPFEHNNGFESVTQFVEREIDNFLLGYHRDKQKTPPIYIEVLGEKNTLFNIIAPICREYYVPMQIGRGYSGPSIFHKMARRFEASQKDEMTLLAISDCDPEGLDLMRDAVVTLRDIWDIPLNCHRVGVTRDQIDELDLAEDFNPAKDTSPRFDAYVAEMGTERTWECEALPPDYLQGELSSSIEANMNREIFRAEQEHEKKDVKELHRLRTELMRQF
jgi:ParB-like nuclease family protein